jgi:hypothetical protein
MTRLRIPRSETAEQGADAQVRAAERLEVLCGLTPADIDDDDPELLCMWCGGLRPLSRLRWHAGERGLVCAPPCEAEDRLYCDYCGEVAEDYSRPPYCSVRCADAAERRATVLADAKASRWRMWTEIDRWWRGGRDE